MTATAVFVPVMAVLLAAGVMFVDRQTVDNVTAGPPPEHTTPEPAPPTRSLGNVSGVDVEVSPTSGLRDGDLVEVRVDGLEKLPESVILICAGDVTEADAAASCDVNAAQRMDPAAVESGGMMPAADGEQPVSVTRTIHISRNSDEFTGDPVPYDCATEEAGCVLAVGPYALPPRAVLVPLSFRDDPPRTPSVEVVPSTDLVDGQEVTVTAEDLRPNWEFWAVLCEAAPSQTCEAIDESTTRASADGTLTLSATVRTVIYAHQGRVDCVARPCTIRIMGGSWDEQPVEAPIAFADGVEAPAPRLRIDPPGPYVDGQVVTLHGTGFPPGTDLADQIGQCPADKDTAVEERCGYGARAPMIVGEDGTFTARVTLWETLPLTGSCATGPGCVLAWVIPHGPIAASAPLNFSP